MFEKSFIDTSVILRLLLNDNPKKRNACETLIKESKQKGIMLYVMPIAIMETVWVLERVFKFKREEIRDLVQAILNTPELKIEESDVFSKAIDDYCQKNIKFADAVMARQGIEKDCSIVYTYDAHFKRIKELEVRAP